MVFLPNNSCLTNLSVLLTHAIKSISDNSQLDVVYLDFSKAFDKININMLLYKLSNRFNIHGKFLSLLSDYLSNRELVWFFLIALPNMFLCYPVYHKEVFWVHYFSSIY